MWKDKSPQDTCCLNKCQKVLGQKDLVLKNLVKRALNKMLEQHFFRPHEYFQVKPTVG